MDARASGATDGKRRAADFTFVGGRLWLDFVNTDDARLGVRVDTVDSFARYVDWLEAARIVIGGKAEAMVVTSSRKHAVRYKRAFDRYLAEQGYTDLKVLVAFSGTVEDDGVEYTEPGMNRSCASRTPTWRSSTPSAGC